MTDIIYKTQEEGNEKHLPILKKNEYGLVEVQVGSVLHPMDEDHFITLVEIVLSSGEVMKQTLRPGQTPVALFDTAQEVVELRAFCNKHGRWKNVL